MNQRLRASMQGIRGGKNKGSEIGFGLLSYYKDGQNKIDISIDTFEGAGATYKEREEAFIVITFFDGKTKPFQGTVSELMKQLNK